MAKDVRNITQKDIKEWIIVKFVRLVIFAICVGISLCFAALLGKGNNGLYVGIGTNALIRQLKEDKILPEDFMDTEDSEDKSYKVIIITICVLAVIMTIFAAFLVYNLLKQKGGL